MLLLACSAPAAEVRPIGATPLLDCPLEGTATLELEALDDGAPRASSFVEVSPSAGVEIDTLPPGATGFLARGRDTTGELTSLGVLSLRAGRAHGALYRVNTACALRDDRGARARFPIVLQPSVASSGRYAILVGGRDREGTPRSDAIVIDAERGVSVRLGLRRRRVGAAVAIAGDRALIAGGQSEGDTWEDAEVVDLGNNTVLSNAIALAEKRADGAALLLSSGEVLLIGGRGSSGALRTMEALDPARGTARTIDVASLASPRRSPRAVRLSTGEIVVLGGTNDAGAPVNDVEVFDATASRRLRVLSFASSAWVSAIGLPSGSALVVHGDATVTHAAMITADAVFTLADPPHGGSARLVDATDGAPFLFNGANLRFQPFTQRFEAAVLPPTLASDLSFALDHGSVGVARIEDDQLAIRALRYDLRPPLVNDAEALGLGSTAHLSPDRPGPLVGREGLVITPRARVAVTDATYRGVLIRLGGNGRDLPLVELRGEDGALVAEIGERCPWPVGAGGTSEIVRGRDGAITLRVGDVTRHCSPLVVRERVTVAFVAGAAEARLAGVTLTRY